MENKTMTLEIFGEIYTVKSYAELIIKNAENKIKRYKIDNESILSLAIQDVDEHIAWYSCPFFQAVKKEIQINYGK